MRGVCVCGPAVAWRNPVSCFVESLPGSGCIGLVCGYVHGKPLENPGKTLENPGKPWKNPGKLWKTLESCYRSESQAWNCPKPKPRGCIGRVDHLFMLHTLYGSNMKDQLIPRMDEIRSHNFETKGKFLFLCACTHHSWLR